MSASYDSAWGEARVVAWRRRGLDLWAALGDEVEPYVSGEAIGALLEDLIAFGNPACHDRSNAAHVMAQNDNLIVLARWAEAPPQVLAVALAAGLVHDLNKALDEPLRQDTYAVRTKEGGTLTALATQPLVVGLNHYGERTRATLERLVDLGRLDDTTAREIDRCIVHHGLGSSRFIRALVRGELGFGRDDYLDGTGAHRLVLPAQPSPTLATVLHDLADSAQQMQAGGAWVAKYPLGYWRRSGASWAALLSGDAEDGEMPLGLEGQLRIERQTCQAILREALAAEVLSGATALRLERGVEALVDAGRAWVDDRPDTLVLPHGSTVYHQLAQLTGTAVLTVRDRLARLRPGDEPELDARVLRAAQVLDDARARQLYSAIAERGCRRPTRLGGGR